MAFDLSGVLIFYEDFAPTRPSQFDAELDALASADAVERRSLRGICNLAGAETDFSVSSDNLREDIVAQTTNSINRHRQVVCALSMALFGHPQASLAGIAEHVNRTGLRVYSAEANSALFLFLKEHLNPELFTYSEYFGEEHRSGDVVGEVCHQDLQRPSFPDESFDVVITCEVFEHIPDAIGAEREVVRILKPGGVYCFTVPFIPHGEHDLVLAERTPDGEIKHFAEPQYHGDPLRPEEGILVYRVFAFRDLKHRFESLGCRFRTYRFWSRSLGILGNNGWVHIVRKTFNDGGAAVASGVEELGFARRGEEAAEARLRLSDAEWRCQQMADALAGTQAELERQRAELLGLQRLLTNRDEVIRWMQTSRSWRMASSLRQLAGRWRPLSQRLRGLLNRAETDDFRGALESPAEGALVSQELNVEGWVFTVGAPVVRVEAFLGGNYLGTVSYGVERPDVTSARESHAPTACGYREKIPLQAARAGREQLTIRVFDARGGEQSYTRSVIVE
jgi:SAM-dependent methyltransferase